MTTNIVDEYRPVLDLSNCDGNAYAIIGRASKAIRQTGATKEYIQQFRAEATSGDYDHVMATVERYCEVDIEMSA
tara:strand:+ start:950 stop:1174 length:225 start_codon:yes stop_codon:yes gene_type:complete